MKVKETVMVIEKEKVGKGWVRVVDVVTRGGSGFTDCWDPL